LVLGFKKIISDPQNIVAIEWAERLGKILPKNTICLHFDFLDKKTRKITISKNHNSMLK
jgi:tRNA threonylcarbamoyladenosine biosynthesis protein TsaE